uniref:Protein kinase C-binding protein 1-like n=1 Tax=Phallusia mammillata TaxID=59560 RepID=A0A6F9DY68_9ASCI|nr:protein kinase C-binding protein 1-like [Phallusia mammillata]
METEPPEGSTGQSDVASVLAPDPPMEMQTSGTAPMHAFPASAQSAETTPVVTDLSGTAAQLPMEFSAPPEESTSKTTCDTLPSGANSQPVGVQHAAMDTEQTSTVPTANTPVVGKSMEEDEVIPQQRAITPEVMSLTKDDRIEMIMPKTPSEGSIKSISPSSLSSGSRSRKSSLSSKSPKAHSPGNVASPGSQGRPRKTRPPPPIKDDTQHDGRNDFYCWICHREGEVLCCELCPRVFHAKCLHMQKEPEGDWYCPECQKVMDAECKETQSRAMSQMSIDQLALHLRYALQRMKTTGCEPFLEPVDTKKFSDYLDYVFHPMDLSTLEKNVKKRKYGCTEAFLSDVKWIVHNCVIYNGLQTKLTQIAKSIVKICQHEMSEIEVCPECYLNSCRKRENWFCEPCKEPHILVWAKLQGFPHWPAKALRIDKGMVDARFFGQHDRAWIPLSGCYLMSKEMPFPVKNKKKGRGPGAKGGLDNAMLETQNYIDNVIRKTGSFDYSPLRTPLTHMDLYRRSTGIPTSNNPTDSVVVKKEAIEEESKSPALLGSSVLNLKLAGSDLKESLEGSSPSATPPKKKSKIVTTSGAHPGGGQKGIRSFAHKKQASLLEKTIESCKASLRDSFTNSDDDSSSDESDTSSDESNDEIAATKSSTNSVEKGADDKTNADGTTEKSAPKPTNKVGQNSDESDSELVIDIPEDEEAKKRDEKGNLQKSIIKVKKKGESDKSLKPKSILLNKDPGKITEAPARPAVGSGSIKRKMGEESSSGGGILKARKVDGMTKPSDASGVKDGKIMGKEKKKLPSDQGKHPSDKAKKYPETSSKVRKDGSGVTAKKTNPEGIVRKKIMMTEIPKTKPPEDRTNLKSAAKILSQKVMSRKHTSHPSEKQKTLDKQNFQDKSKSSFGDSGKRLSSFTIPKHKPTAVRPTEEPVRTSTMTTRTSIEASHDGKSTSATANGNFPIQKIEKYNEKVMIGVRQVLVEMYEDMMTEMDSQPSKDSSGKDSDVSHQVNQLQLELDRLKWMHQQEIAELQHNHDLTIAEIRQSLENEKLHLLEEAKRKSEAAKLQAIEETKQKQWCANCGKEAIFYCCWNTSYCDYPCQQLHWPKHMATCSQARDANAGNTSTAGGQDGGTPQAKVKEMETEPEMPADTPTSPFEDPIQPKDISKPVVEEVKESVDVDEEEDESDTEMMVIDESLHKDDEEPEEKIQSPKQEETPKPVEQMDSTISQDVEEPTNAVAETPKDVCNEKKPDAADEKPLDQPSMTSAKESTGQSVETDDKNRSPNPVKPIEEKPATPLSIVSTLANEIKPMPLPLRTPAGTSSNTNSGTSTTVVPSKLLDDIFSKVLEKENDVNEDKPAAVESSADESPAKIIAGSPKDGLPVKDIPCEAQPKETLKIQHSGDAISAIGDRLLKAKQKSEESVKVESGSPKPSDEEKKESSSINTELIEPTVSPTPDSPAQMTKTVDNVDDDSSIDKSPRSEIENMDYVETDEKETPTTESKNTQEEMETDQNVVNEECKTEVKSPDKNLDQPPSPVYNQSLDQAASPVSNQSNEEATTAEGDEDKSSAEPKLDATVDEPQSPQQKDPVPKTSPAKDDSEPPVPIDDTASTAHDQPPASSVSAPVFSDSYLSCLTKSKPADPPDISAKQETDDVSTTSDVVTASTDEVPASKDETDA